ncbi:MAG: efflux RND transporter permease subunit [Sphingomonadales bacterium]|nr:efflux RND transporter permease subunit [Sphingomonadales bacterium]
MSKLNFKEFGPTSWSIDNKTSIYVLSIFISIAGIFSYNALPKEQFPDIVIPTIIVQTVYPGSSPKDIENLITKPLEKKIKSVSGVKKLKSNSIQDFSIITVEFDTDVKVDQAKQKVKDQVDKAKSDLPNDLKTDPIVQEINFSDMPVLYINISGDIDLPSLKRYAELAKDKIESLPSITRVDIVGALDRELQVNLDLTAMATSGLTMDDVTRAIQYENMRISGGNIDVDKMQRSLSVSGEFRSKEEIENVVIRSGTGATLYLRDVAEVVDGYKEKESYARLEGKNVITLNVVKRAGENLIEASDKCHEIVKGLQDNGSYPKEMEVVFTGDQSVRTRTTVHDLINTIIIGFILVTVILMFFMGATNAIFVGLSVPLSCFIAFLVMPTIGFSLNMIVLFAFLLALGIVVDDAIVVIENTHRIFHKERLPIKEAAKKAAGEVFMPVLSGTMTTLAPFIPLAFWKGIVGKFMFFLPVTLIITLLASLLVAYIINPVFAVDFMEDEHAQEDHAKTARSVKRTTLVMGIVAILGYLLGGFGIGNFVLTLLGVYLLHHYWLRHVIVVFQTKTWPGVQNAYERVVRYLLEGSRPRKTIFATIALLILSFVVTAIRKPGVVFFPQADPNFTYVYLTLPTGTNAKHTDSILKIAEKRVFKAIGQNNPLVESVISNVAVGATDPNSGDRTTASNKGKITVAYVEFEKRDGGSTMALLKKIRESIGTIAGAEIVVEQEKNGPPVGKAVNIEIRGDEFESLVSTATKLKTYLDNKKIAGVEELKTDFISSKPEVIIKIDRERANRFGISTAQIGMALRGSIYGTEASKFKDDNDDYPIMVRVKKVDANNLDALLNMRITYRDMVAGGMIRQVPLSSVASAEYSNTYGGINRMNQKRVITLASNVLAGYQPNEVVSQVNAAIESFDKPSDIQIIMTGEQEQQAETGAFLGNAMLASLALILIILVTQFNSISKPLLILSEIFLSLIGVLLGFAIFNKDFSVVMTGIGIVALVGIVVRNGILLVEFTDLLREQGATLKSAIIEAGRTRMTPVLLTASATILGLVPLAVGLNMDFATLFTELNPHIYFGGDNVAFWGPLSWTMIYGLGFATFLTLILVPCMYYLNEKFKARVYGWMGRHYDPDTMMRPEAKK